MKGYGVKFPGITAIWLILACSGLHAQPESGAGALSERGEALLSESRFTEAEQVFRNWTIQEPANPKAYFGLAMSQGLQGRHDDALVGFRKALSLDPHFADAWFEIAGICVLKQRYRDGIEAVRHGLKIDPDNEYGLDVAGTLKFLSGDRLGALFFWNKLGRPRLGKLLITSSKPLNRQRIADEIDMKPNSILSYSELEKSQWRLRQHKYIRSAVFTPVPEVAPHQYDLEVKVDSRQGFGSPIEVLASAISGVGFHTYRFSYANLYESGVTIDGSMRFKSTGRWMQLEFNLPRPAHLDLYGTALYAWRDESWSFEGMQKNSASDAVYRLRMHEVTGSVLQPVKLPRILIDTTFAVRRRILESPEPIEPAAEGNAIGSSRRWDWVSWFRLSPNIEVFDCQSPSGWKWQSQFKTGIDLGLSKNSLARNPSRFSGSLEGRIESPSNEGLRKTIRWGVHGGTMSQSAFMEDYFRLGVGPDVPYQLRAHPLFKEGILGATPLASRFLLGNITVSRDIHNWKYFSLGLSAFCDSAKIRRSYSKQSFPSSAVDAGTMVQVGLRGSSSMRFAVTYAKDLRTGRNVYYFSTVLR
jgi:tetratricopeptide (TPR) repeat protein